MWSDEAVSGAGGRGGGVGGLGGMSSPCRSCGFITICGEVGDGD